MYFISDIVNVGSNRKEYGIMDTTDGVVEYYSLKSLNRFLEIGISIENYKDIMRFRKADCAKLVLLNNKDFVFSWSELHGVMADYVGEGLEVKVPNGVNCLRSVLNRQITALYLPDSCSVIGDNCCLQCEKLRYIKFPNRPYRIRSSAFRFCRSLTHLDLSNCYAIQPMAFDCCSGVFNVLSLGRVDKLDCTFKNCHNLKSVPLQGSNVRKIGNNAFVGSGIEDVIIPPEVQYLDIGSFNITCNIDIYDKTVLVGVVPNDNINIYRLVNGERVYIRGKKAGTIDF